MAMLEPRPRAKGRRVADSTEAPPGGSDLRAAEPATSERPRVRRRRSPGPTAPAESTSPVNQSVEPAAISERAYLLHLEDPARCADDNWYLAEQELRAAAAPSPAADAGRGV